MFKQDRKNEKTADNYRRDIFTLKNKIKEQEQYLQEIKQKCSQVDIFQQKSYTFQMKVKILECDLQAVKQKIFKYSKDTHSSYYQLNFCAYAFSRACTVIGITPEMVFRSVNITNQKFVKRLDLENFMREVLRMDSSLFNPILNQLHPNDTNEITENRFRKFLCCFMIETEKSQKQINYINESVDTVCRELLRMQIMPHLIWNTKLLNIATTAGGLKQKIKTLDTLDCVAIYCRCDPTKQGSIQSEKAVSMLEHKMQDVRNFKSSRDLRLKQ